MFFNGNKCEIVLAALFIIYLIIGNRDNEKLAEIVDIPQMKAVIIIISFLLFVHCNKVLGILGIFVAYEMLNFSHVMMNEKLVRSFNEDSSSYANLTPFINLKSIEEEIIYNMIPHAGINIGECPYKPFQSFR